LNSLRTGAQISVREDDGAGSTVVAVWGEVEEVADATSEIDDILLDERERTRERVVEMAQQNMVTLARVENAMLRHNAVEDLILRPMGMGTGMGFGIGMTTLALPPMAMELAIPMRLGHGEMVMGIGSPPNLDLAPRPGQIFPAFFNV